MNERIYFARLFYSLTHSLIDTFTIRPMKHQLLEKIKQIVEKRMNTSFEAMEAAKKSANEEGKSSAGDKYETARAMGQIDREMNGRMYEQARQERQSLDKIDPNIVFTKVAFGALVETTMGQFFVSIGVGVVEFEGKNIMAISPQSPIGQAITGKKTRELFDFRGKTQKVILVS
jgi:transcription elongation GreA/GreB family factor